MKTMPETPGLPTLEDTPTLRRMHWTGYLQFTARWMQRCRTEGILFGPGRGSAAASPTLRHLNIIHPGLPATATWHRWLSGTTTPDIDIDVAASQRDHAIRLMRQGLPSGWTLITPPNPDGTPGTGLFAIHDTDPDLTDTPDAKQLEQQGHLKIDLLPSRELDIIRWATATPWERANARWLSTLSWLPANRFIPTHPIDWTPQATQAHWRTVTACPAAFFQFHNRPHPTPPIHTYGQCLTAMAGIRPGAGHYTFQDDAMQTLVDHGLTDWDHANRLRKHHDDTNLAERARHAGLEDAVNALETSYTYCKAHAIAYAAIIDTEARLATRNPHAWIEALYDETPERFRDPRPLLPLSGKWRADPTRGAGWHGIAHIKGIGPVNAHAIQTGLLFGRPRQSTVTRPDPTRWAHAAERLRATGWADPDRVRTILEPLILENPGTPYRIPATLWDRTGWPDLDYDATTPRTRWGEQGMRRLEAHGITRGMQDAMLPFLHGHSFDSVDPQLHRWDRLATGA